jgi:class 3 adenylate cyclase
VWCLETRVAIDTGKVIWTSVGSPDRRDQTLIGQPVNQAAHLSEKATPGTVWISQGTYEKLVDKDSFKSRTTPIVLSEETPPTVYEIARP